MSVFRPFNDLLNVLFSPSCVSCGKTLVGDERFLCVNCLSQIPYTGFEYTPDNQLEALLVNTIPNVKAAALMHYVKNECPQRIVHEIKYHNNLGLGKLFGRLLGSALSNSHRFDDVDVIVPVPLHLFRWLQRGYNQSRIISSGVAETFPRPICNNLIVRSRYTTTQTRKSHQDRVKNVDKAFSIKRGSSLEGKHILLLDDVITTGSTVRSCYEALSKIKGVTVSVAALAYAGT